MTGHRSHEVGPKEATPERSWRVFAPEPREVFSARHFVASVLKGWGLDSGDLPLLVSELATNAVLHARSDFVVTVIRLPQKVRVEVLDQNTRLPSFAVAPPDAHSGRGLLILQKLAGTWGVESHSDQGKTIWFEVPLPASVNGQARRGGPPRPTGPKGLDKERHERS
jgi:anti-sigma regulatory factor (Ser/Thr protein kinase)